jgi:hypothetical protein
VVIDRPLAGNFVKYKQPLAGLYIVEFPLRFAIMFW